MAETDDLLAPIPRPHVRFNLSNDSINVDGTPSSSSNLSPNSSSSSILPPPTSPHPVAPFTAYSDADESSSRVPPLYNYSPQPHETSSIVASTDDSSSYYPPKPLASNISSRETQFDLDSDELDTDYYNEDGAAPLMEGLLDHPRAKRGSLDLRGEDRRLKALERDAEEHEPPDWLTRGGGVWAGIANMSNSILGAGIIGKFPSLSSLEGGMRKLYLLIFFPSLSLFSLVFSACKYRFTLCTSRSGIIEWNSLTTRVGSRNRLDDSVDCIERENERKTELYRYYG